MVANEKFPGDAVPVLSGLKAGERVITSDYTGFEKVDRVDLAR